MECRTLILIIASFGIIFLAILNTISALLGAGLIYIGVLIRDELEKHEDIIELMELIDFGSITLKEVVDIVIRIIITTGVLAIITSILGGVGACFKIRLMLALYIIILVICIILEWTILGYWIQLLDWVHELLFGEFNKLLEKYEGPTELHLISAGWNAIFILFTCCGVRPITISYNDFETLSTPWWNNNTIRGSDVIPQSCCENVKIDNYLNYTDTSCTQGLVGYHKAGCYDVFQELFDYLASIAITIVSVIILIEVAAIFFSSVIIYMESTRRKTGVVV